MQLGICGIKKFKFRIRCLDHENLWCRNDIIFTTRDTDFELEDDSCSPYIQTRLKKKFVCDFQTQIESFVTIFAICTNPFLIATPRTNNQSDSHLKFFFSLTHGARSKSQDILFFLCHLDLTLKYL